jgi:hypothetical protein
VDHLQSEPFRIPKLGIGTGVLFVYHQMVYPPLSEISHERF